MIVRARWPRAKSHCCQRVIVSKFITFGVFSQRGNLFCAHFHWGMMLVPSFKLDVLLCWCWCVGKSISEIWAKAVQYMLVFVIKGNAARAAVVDQQSSHVLGTAVTVWWGFELWCFKSALQFWGQIGSFSTPSLEYGSKNMTETSSMLNSLAAGYLLPVLGALGPCLTLVHYKFTRNLTQPVFSTNKTRAPLLKCQTFSFSYKPILLLRPDFTERLHCFFVITSYSLSSACHIG